MVREVLEIKEQAAVVAQELIEVTRLQKGQLLVIGCSSSEIVGQRIGKGSSKQAAEAVLKGERVEDNGILANLLGGASDILAVLGLK